MPNIEIEAGERPDASQSDTDRRLLEAGVPQAAIDRLPPEIEGKAVWDPDRFMFVNAVKEPCK